MTIQQERVMYDYTGHGSCCISYNRKGSCSTQTTPATAVVIGSSAGNPLFIPIVLVHKRRLQGKVQSLTQPGTFN